MWKLQGWSFFVFFFQNILTLCVSAFHILHLHWWLPQTHSEKSNATFGPGLCSIQGLCLQFRNRNHSGQWQSWFGRGMGGAQNVAKVWNTDIWHPLAFKHFRVVCCFCLYSSGWDGTCWILGRLWAAACLLINVFKASFQVSLEVQDTTHVLISRFHTPAQHICQNLWKPRSLLALLALVMVGTTGWLYNQWSTYRLTSFWMFVSLCCCFLYIKILPQVGMVETRGDFLEIL